MLRPEPEPGRGDAGLVCGGWAGHRGREQRGAALAHSPGLCLHTHLAPARTQITLIHFKPTLSQEALQQILLKPYLHNVGRPITPSLDRGHLERVETLVRRDLQTVSLANLSH